HLRSSETVIVDLDFAMNGLPLEALKSPEGWYFGEKFAVIYSPGYLRENDLRMPLPQRPRLGLLVDALGATSEREKLSELFPEIKPVDGADIAPGDLRALLEASEIFVFIGHGESGSLILSNQTPVKAEDFPAESLSHLQLAVLAACSSGLSPDGL